MDAGSDGRQFEALRDPSSFNTATNRVVARVSLGRQSWVETSCHSFRSLDETW